ncbi:UDP-3-O-(3-hydroxymyristoyl)glucosamine N-acyltransferase [Grimontia celer]|uniref:UDP-3-O-(3-hydroxymyristoyl)glucosamine N-acyltransferase n=1 Tax=Grimontia celer TaxID=1796497 RepID=A0A128F048_9GAMM|nr:UDP-3-O-(3-hydroxymyristoyl)glucosamine N-acyltransferase [Grimontia celer]CZF80167.1 UDP-3-O-(3-hydroxymyristoyl)glucosamine N-acyltransferase [Grimontia celer]
MKKALRSQIFAHELASALGLELIGERNCIIKEIVSVSNAVKFGLCFSKKANDGLISGIVIGLENVLAESLIVSENPRLDFCRALSWLIDNGCLEVGNNEGKIHDNTSIAPTAVIEEGVEIGEHTVIEHNVVIHKGTKIGSRCIIRSGTVLGAQGFGFEKNEKGEWERFPHIGGLKIGNNVEIGALNSVCIGAIDDTIIEDGVKTDNLVHIAHNCRVGKNSILTACVELSGGVVLGEGVWMGPNSSTMQKIKIGDYALVGVGSTVTKSVNPNYTVAGNPAKVIKKS